MSEVNKILDNFNEFHTLDEFNKKWRRQPQTPNYPHAVNLKKVGNYPGGASGGGFFWDEVLEYRVWIHQMLFRSGFCDDFYDAFSTYRKALGYAAYNRPDTAVKVDEPLVVVLQRRWLSQVSATGKYVMGKHTAKEFYYPKYGGRIAEWRVEWLGEDNHKPTSEAITKKLKILNCDESASKKVVEVYA